MKNSTKNFLKIVFLGLMGFSFLVYLTLPPKVNKTKSSQKSSKFPEFFEVVGKKAYVKKDELFKKDAKTYIIVLNHDSLIYFKDLYKYINSKDIVLVANVSKTPWFMKKLAVDDKLNEMYKNSKIPLINDDKGVLVNTLGLNDDTQNAYFTYLLDKKGAIKYLSKGLVKKDALQNDISQKELEDTLKSVVKQLN